MSQRDGLLAVPPFFVPRYSRRIMRNLLLILAAFAVCGSLMSGCGPSSDPDPVPSNPNPNNGTPEGGGAAVQQSVD